ncbi:hypothetical protein AKO1_012717 [Acrasis kona]|uniref:Uncharacterized protein n=1 Tax=Acrasis kona TaxID=1008807 RepID=A0AAW2YRG2_9EUKA
MKAGFFIVLVVLILNLIHLAEGEAFAQFSPPRDLLENENVLSHLKKQEVDLGDHAALVGDVNTFMQDPEGLSNSGSTSNAGLGNYDEQDEDEELQQLDDEVEELEELDDEEFDEDLDDF